MSCKCHIVPNDVLQRLSSDTRFSADVRKALADTARVSAEIRKLRTQAGLLTNATQSTGAHVLQLAGAPDVFVYDCKHTQTLPGAAIPNPQNSADPTAKRTFSETTLVAEFYKQVFNRNSVDNAGMTLF